MDAVWLVWFIDWSQGEASHRPYHGRRMVGVVFPVLYS